MWGEPPATHRPESDAGDGERFLRRAGFIIVMCELFSSTINLSYNNADADGMAEGSSSQQPRLLRRRTQNWQGAKDGPRIPAPSHQRDG